MSAKLVDLPTIIESQKTIDKKTFYKTADICQLLVCREGEATEDEEETAAAAAQQKKGKKNDPNKVRKCEDRAMDTSVMGREGYGG